VRRRGDGRYVLHLKGRRARRFEIDDPGIRARQPDDLLADQRVVTGEAALMINSGVRIT
jgi:hypothetical protein